jgi:hypothetical protein
MLKAMTLSAAAVIALSGLSASAQERVAPQSKGRACFAINDIASWEDARGGRMNIRTARGEYYQATLLGPCVNLDLSQKMVIIPRNGFSRRICEGDDATIKVRGETCRADQFRKLTPDEVAALPKTDRP